MTRVTKEKDTKMTARTGAENVRWDLSFLYSGIDDPQIDKDVQTYREMLKKFHDTYKGRLHSKLGAALVDLGEITRLSSKFAYTFLLLSQDTANDAATAKEAAIDMATSAASAEHLTFFDHELVKLEESTLEGLYVSDPVVAQHRPLIEQTRIFKPHMLTEEVESALTKRQQFGPSSWSNFFDKVESKLRFKWKRKELDLNEMLHLLSSLKGAKERAAVLRVINAGLGGYFADFATETLNQMAGLKSIEDKDRGYKHPMEARNKSSMIDDSIVESLHQTVTETSDLCRAYYRRKARLLNMKKLRWSDRNAPMPFAKTSNIPWDTAIRMVLEAYGDFSPTLRSLVERMLHEDWLDVAPGKGRRGGAYNCSLALPGDRYAALTFQTYQGSARDVMTLAHELGHGVHGLLAGPVQGPLMMRASPAYSETASIFGEKLVFEYLSAELKRRGDDEQLLSLVMGKLDDVVNTIFRQIGFSNFERALHGHDGNTLTRRSPKKHSVDEMRTMWRDTRAEIYGPNGDVFEYGDDENLIFYVSHFHGQSPFYVYGYVVGDLLTNSLYAAKDSLGERFEPMYLDMLRAGGTKGLADLVRPFGLDPSDPKFWRAGLDASIGTLLREADQLIEKLGK